MSSTVIVAPAAVQNSVMPYAQGVSSLFALKHRSWMNPVQPRNGEQNSFEIADREWVGTFLPYVEVFHSQATFWEYRLLLGPEVSKFNGVCDAQIGCTRKKPSREQSLVCGNPTVHNV